MKSINISSLKSPGQEVATFQGGAYGAKGSFFMVNIYPAPEMIADWE